MLAGSVSPIVLPGPAELIEFDPRWKELKAQFGAAPLHGLAYALNRAGVAWDNGDETPARMGPPGSALLALKPCNPAYRWAASECMRQGLMWSPSYAFESPLAQPDLMSDTVLQLVHRATSAQLEVVPTDEAVLSSSGVWDFLYPTWSPQFLMARSSALRTGQALWMFKDALAARKARLPDFPAERLGAAFTSALEMPVDQFLRLVLMIYGRSVSEQPTLRADIYSASSSADAFGVVSQGFDGVYRTHVGAVLRILAADSRAMREWMAATTDIPFERITDIDFLRSPNPLLRFPLLRPFHANADYLIAPVPSCLLEWLYEPMVNFLFGSLDPNLRTAFALAFEEYVGLVLNRYRPGGSEWLSEAELVPRCGGKVVDWARPFPSTVVLVDAKRCFVEPVMRYRLDADDWEVLEQALVRGVEQGAEFWASVQRNEVTALAGCKEKAPLLLLVSQSDTSVIGMQERIQTELARLAAARCPQLTVAVLSLDQLQHLATNWLERDDCWLESLLRDIVAMGRGIISTQAPHQAQGPLWDETARLLDANPAVLAPNESKPV